MGKRNTEVLHPKHPHQRIKISAGGDVSLLQKQARVIVGRIEVDLQILAGIVHGSPHGTVYLADTAE